MQYMARRGQQEKSVACGPTAKADLSHCCWMPTVGYLAGAMGLAV
jgi:hypothetical protein